MSYEKQNWVPYDDNLSEEENINVGAVVTAERMNHLESGIQQHTNDEENPHKVTKAQVGLSNVTDVEQASKVDFEAHATNNLNPHGVTASQVGLGNVENIRQAAKDYENTFSEDNIFLKDVNVNGKTTSRTMEVVEEFTAASITASGLITASAGIVDASGNSFVRENANMLIYREALINADWNTILTTGFYYVSDLSNQINKPPVITASGYLVIYNQLGSQLGEIIQEYHASNGDIAVRSYNSTSQSWGDWFGKLIQSIEVNTWNFANNFTDYGTGTGVIRVLSDGTNVQMLGNAKNISEIPSDAQVPMLTLKLSMRPSVSFGGLFQASGSSMWHGRMPGYEGPITGTTEFIFERHRGWLNNTFGYRSCGAGSWLYINAPYIAAKPIALKDLRQ